MYNVQKTNVRDDKFLTGLAVRYQNNEFVGTEFMPEYGVQKESDKYRIFRKDGFYKGAPKKADGAITEEATLSYDEGTYSTYERAIKDIVTDRAVQNADAPVPNPDDPRTNAQISISSESKTFSVRKFVASIFDRTGASAFCTARSVTISFIALSYVEYVPSS